MRHSILPERKRQSGAVLIVAMVILVILTMLGVTAMNTTALQERIASNTQEQVHAFQAAETALNLAFSDELVYFDLTGTYTGGEMLTYIAGSADRGSYITTFLGYSPPPFDSGYSATKFRAAHFNLTATGTSASNLSVVLNGGSYQITRK